MELMVYRIFDAIVSTRSMVKAAESLYMTPSAVSHAISKLENECGFPLFIRGKNGITMTAYGAELLPHIRGLLQMNDKLNEEVDMLCSIKRGKISLGVFNSVCCGWLPEILRSMHGKYPEITVAVTEGGYTECEDGLLSGKLDIAFVRPPVSDKLAYYQLFEDRMVCIASPDFHPLWEGFITVSEIQEQPLILSQEGYQSDVKEFFDRNGIVASLPHSLIDDSSIMALVESGLGISILPELVIKHIAGNIQILQIEKGPSRIIGIATHKMQYVTPATKLFLQETYIFLSKRYRDLNFSVPTDIKAVM